jgi:sugar O-acyltransferase (sialic acid O-acetyltransferase NeuD family)
VATPLTEERKDRDLKRLLIVGAGGFGREVLGWARQIPQNQRDWDIAGFLDANPRALEGYPSDVSILGDPAHHAPSRDDRFLCAVGDPRTRMRVVEDLEARGGRFLTLIHPSVVVGPHCHIGEGCILCPGVVLTTNVTLGRLVILNVHSSVGHDAVVGDGCTLSGHCDVTGQAVLGRCVFMGSHATILPRARVGDHAVVGAGSVVLVKAPPRATVMGVPAKLLPGFERT